jgi:hypothetical protein
LAVVGQDETGCGHRTPPTAPHSVEESGHQAEGDNPRPVQLLASYVPLCPGEKAVQNEATQ